MASVYEEVLQGVQQLTPQDLLRLRLELEIKTRSLSQSSPPKMTTQQARERLDELASRIGAAWTDPSMSAVDAVREQRREL